MIDQKGYLKVVDFGFAKIIEGPAFTLCGTPDYLAPEIIAETGHGLAVDWWALGVLIFEMLVGAPPFKGDDTPSLYKQIEKAKVSFPKGQMSKGAQAIISELLRKKPKERLGSGAKGHAQLIGHAWLKGRIDVKSMPQMGPATPPPYVPTIRSDEDVLRNFCMDGVDEWHAEVDELERELTPEECKLFSAFSL